MKVKTGHFIAAGVGAFLVWEAWTLVNKEKEDTISETLWRQMRRPLIPFLLGAVVSHFVWQDQDVYDSYVKRARAKRG